MSQPLTLEVDALDRTNAVQAKNITRAPINNRGRGKRLEWALEVKVLLIKIETEERERGNGFMKRVKKRWSNEARKKKSVSAQNLVDNARRFKLEEEVMDQLEG